MSRPVGAVGVVLSLEEGMSKAETALALFDDKIGNSESL